MGKSTKSTKKGKDRNNSERRGNERRKGDQAAMRDMFTAYGFKDERKDAVRRSGRDRRDDV